MRELTFEQWNEEGERRFGTDRAKWRFVCPVCKHVASAQDWRDAGAPEGALAFSCVGRWLEAPRRAFEDSGVGPCNYAGGGLFRLNPVRVVRPQESDDEVPFVHEVFEFAETGV